MLWPPAFMPGQFSCENYSGFEQFSVLACAHCTGGKSTQVVARYPSTNHTASVCFSHKWVQVIGFWLWLIC